VLAVANLVAGFQALGTLMAVGLMMLPAAAARFWARAVWGLGLGFEGWMDRLVSSSGFKGRRVVASDGIATLRTKGHGHSHGHAGHSHGKGGVDPHVWQDPLRVQQMVRSIARGLGAADPSRAAIYDANAAAYVAKLGELDRWIVGELATVPAARRKIITSHDAFAYFAARYGVEFRAPRGVNMESEPSAADLGRIIREIRRDKVKIVFLENISDPRMIEQVARESGAQMGGRLYSDALSRADGPAPTYLALMRHNVTRLRDAMRSE
jgi:zinc/manganese transport system substrate-binding protein